MPISNDEADRLAALESYDILDSGPEESFDRITRMAGRLLDVPICLVSLIDKDRQWFKSRQGLDATETPRDLAFCAHAIQCEEVMVVPNALEDARFRDNPLVTGDPCIRFYAGAPLTTRSGHNLGTLCAIDRHPREMTADEQQLLDDLAHMVVDELELRKANRRVSEELTAKNVILQDFDAVFSAIDYGVMFIGPDLKTRMVNDAFCRMWALPEGFEKQGSTYVDLMRHIRDTGIFGSSDFDQAAILKDDNIWLNSTANPIVTARSDGTVLELTCVVLPDGGRMLTCLDVTDREKIIELKNEFVSIVSHELRTPLTSVVAALGMIDKGGFGDIPPETSSIMTIARRNTNRLVDLVNDILDIQKIESGQMDLHLSPVDMVKLAREALAETEILGVEYGVRFKLETDLEEAWVDGDCSRLNQVVSNLVSNAAKFSEENGEVIIRVRRANDAIRLTVIDNGTGVPLRMQDKIFEKFIQVDSSDARAKKGTGLGLSICKAIVEQHSGLIWVESEPGHGSSFHFELVELSETEVRQGASYVAKQVLLPI